MGKLNDLGLKYGTDKASDNHNFLDFYEESLPEDPKRLLEVGTYEGASLAMWRDFYPAAEIVGIDIREPNGIEGVKEYKINMWDTDSLLGMGKFDIIVDDGSHMQADQQEMLKQGLKMLNPGGVFVMEDLHCCYWDIMQDDSLLTTEEVLAGLENRYTIKYFIHEDKTQHYTAIIYT